MEQAEQADPDVEALVEQNGVGHEARAQEEQRERHRIKRVDGGHEQPESNLRAREAVDHHEAEAQEELDRPKLRDLGVGPIAGHRVADRPQEEVRRHDREAGQERHRRGARFVRLDQRRRAADFRRSQDQPDDARADHEAPERGVAEVEQLAERRALLQAQRLVDDIGGDSDPADELDRIERRACCCSHRPRIHRASRPLEPRRGCPKSRFFLSAGARLRPKCPAGGLPSLSLAASLFNFNTKSQVASEGTIDFRENATVDVQGSYNSAITSVGTFGSPVNFNTDQQLVMPTLKFAGGVLGGADTIRNDARFRSGAH